ncbi:sodium:proton exchanger [bacterium]|nr:sodium:proton exchanger [bacterium]
MRGVVLLQPLDLVIGLLVLAFFLVSALISDGDVPRSLLGGGLIMLVMFAVGGSIEVIIDSLRSIPGLGTVVGFITNGPEMLCLLVGLLGDDIIFAASTPLGSNFMNPLMLLAAGLVTGTLGLVFRRDTLVTAVTLLTTATLAAVFFALEPVTPYVIWLVAATVVSALLFMRRPSDPAQVDDGGGLPRWSAIPAVIALVAAGYWLDPVVSLTAEASHAPKGLIGFFVLAALTSWPEFRSCLGLLRRGRTTSAVLNITVSNITNLWLAALGVLVYLAL